VAGIIITAFTILITPTITSGTGMSDITTAAGLMRTIATPTVTSEGCHRGIRKIIGPGATITEITIVTGIAIATVIATVTIAEIMAASSLT
jgi:hypothetical protein